MPIGIAEKCYPLFLSGLADLSLVVPEYDLGLLLEFYRVRF